jgi:hypothetical protein
VTTGIRDRDSLYVKLREVLGDKQAATLMELLPPDRDQLATKADILDVKTELRSDLKDITTLFSQINERMDRMESLMIRFDETLWQLHGTLRSQTRILFTAMLGATIGVGGPAFAAAAFM